MSAGAGGQGLEAGGDARASAGAAIWPTVTGVQFDVRVVPRARKTELAGVRGTAVVVRLVAPPVEGAANQALVDFLADRLHVARRAIRLVSGERHRDKRLAVDGITVQDASARLGL